MGETPDWKTLQALPLFSELTEQEIYQVAHLSFIKNYKKDATLFVEGMAGEVLYVILKGKINVYKKTPKGEILITTLTEGEYVGEMSLIDDGARSATARIAEDSELLVITRKCFKDMLQSDPKITSKLLTQFLKSISVRLRQTDKRLEAM